MRLSMMIQLPPEWVKCKVPSLCPLEYFWVTNKEENETRGVWRSAFEKFLGLILNAFSSSIPGSVLCWKTVSGTFRRQLSGNGLGQSDNICFFFCGGCHHLDTFLSQLSKWKSYNELLSITALLRPYGYCDITCVSSIKLIPVLEAGEMICRSFIVT